MKKILIAITAILIAVSAAQAIIIGYNPGLDKLIDEADVIVILRVDQYGESEDCLSNQYVTHKCLIYQTLKGNLPPDKYIDVQLYNTTSSSISSPFTFLSSHLVFLEQIETTKNKYSYRVIPTNGSHIKLPEIGNEKKFKGKTVADQIRALLKRTLKQNKTNYDREQAFLNKMISGDLDQKTKEIYRNIFQ